MKDVLELTIFCLCSIFILLLIFSGGIIGIFFLFSLGIFFYVFESYEYYANKFKGVLK